jgi:hypothetical protein
MSLSFALPTVYVDPEFKLISQFLPLGSVIVNIALTVLVIVNRDREIVNLRSTISGGRRETENDIPR